MKAREFAPAAFSFWCGFSSLSLEILWVRFFGFAQQASPKAFGFVLSAFLLGVALGAAAGRRRCVRDGDQPATLWRAMAICMLLSGLAAIALPFAFALRQDFIDSRYLGFICIGVTASLLAYCFPISHHLGAQDEVNKGRRFAAVYVSNVAGSAAGPLLVGYVLLDRLTLQQAFEFVALAQLIAGFATLYWMARPFRLGLSPVVIAASAACLAVTALALDKHWLLQQVRVSEKEAKAIYENRYGVISVVEGGRIGDYVYGGNVYDGLTNTDLVINSNGLHRLTLTSVLQPKPRRVLMIGLAIGSWLDVVRRFPGVEHIDVIEINPAYLEAAKAYPAQQAALQDARVSLHIDDGRRWVRQHPGERYDLIVMNTSYHWRSNSTLLLSKEFLTMLRTRLTSAGVLCFNATGSLDALYTATKVFPHASRYDNFVYAAEHDFRRAKDSAQALDAMRALYFAGAVTERGDAQLRKHLAMPFVDYPEARALAGRDADIITDSNMVNEFRYGKAF